MAPQSSGHSGGLSIASVMGVAGAQRSDVLDRLALARDEPVHLVGALALREQLPRPQRRGEHKCTVLQALEQHRPRRGPPVQADGHESNGTRLANAGRPGLHEPTLQHA
jgi:hypothetical protein